MTAAAGPEAAGPRTPAGATGRIEGATMLPLGARAALPTSDPTDAHSTTALAGPDPPPGASGGTTTFPRGKPGARVKGQPFFNPGMALNRDLSVLLVEAFARQRGREVDVADALAGTGARSLRLAREVDAPIVVHANDADAKGVAALRAGAAANALEVGPSARLRASEGDAHVLLAGRRFDVIDLDPCGSPMPFLDAAVRSVRHGGLVCATATDTAALAGKHPRVARRRYGAHHGLHGMAWRAEVGLRILAGAAVRSAARFERGATPVLAVARGHWMRVVVRVVDGAGHADDALAGLGHAVPTATGSGAFADARDALPGPHAGPLWAGPLHDTAILDGMAAARAGKALACPEDVDGLLAVLAAEAQAPAFWLRPDGLQRVLGPPPRRDALMGRLRGAGFAAARSHMDPQGIRTDAGLEDLRALWA